MSYFFVPEYDTDCLHLIKCAFWTTSLTVMLITPGDSGFTNDPLYVLNTKFFPYAALVDRALNTVRMEETTLQLAFFLFVRL